MILPRSIIKVGDNSGVKFIRCIKIIGSTNKRWAKYGEVIKASATVVYTRSKIKQGSVVNALIIRCIRPFNRILGCIKFDESSVIILNDKLEPIGTRIFGSILKELKVINQNMFSLINDVI
ncbi:50S ribosomal protein L14 [Candidatus Hodgkinia cicadicola]|uniref:Large ribosomal subunit protein uL14 n=2 Tax=Candidatus Hodgkinia cicadicola TaxID=573658 RepID=A0ABX4MGU2_9HYPH|nr:50S ribosomal protein L14 [Candidatus Hodgkinia cicadicola]PIM94853.1 50S ribosomal protein L14 [Candidatus Hodgkinia cicadicola]PIM95824.1 50S ribosomal protein L14 [Candidatus Hodgkinia cicadicola]